MRLTEEQRAELESVVLVGYDGSVSTRAQIVLAWHNDESVTDIARRFGTTKPTVYKWVDRFTHGGVGSLENLKPTGRPRWISGSERSRILALTKRPPPKEAGLTHWSTYEMSKYL
jgi:transposase